MIILEAVVEAEESRDFEVKSARFIYTGMSSHSWGGGGGGEGEGRGRGLLRAVYKVGAALRSFLIPSTWIAVTITFCCLRITIGEYYAATA